MRAHGNKNNKKYSEAKKSLILSGIAVSVSIVVLLSFTFGWFSMNKNVTGQGMNVVINSNEFNLFVVGDEGFYDERYNPGLEHGTASTRTTREGETLTGEETIENRDIEWLMNPEGNLKNCEIDENREVITDYDELGIEPGTFGSLEFYVVPLNDGDLHISFEMELTMFSQDYRTTEPATGKFISEAVGNNGAHYYYSEFENNEIKNLLLGHLMFFENREVVNGQYKYSNRIVDGQFTRDFEGAESGVLEKVKIYWVWPYVLGQTILPDGDKNLGNYTRIFNDLTDEFTVDDFNPETADKTESSYDSKRFLYEMTNTADTDINYKYYFYQLAGENLENLNRLSDVICGSASTSFDSEVFGTLSTYWNRADQYVGINVSYIALKINAY